MCFQDTAVTSGAGKKEKHLNESSTISSRSDDCGPSINSEGGNNGLYETLAGKFKDYNLSVACDAFKWFCSDGIFELCTNKALLKLVEVKRGILYSCRLYFYF